MKEASVKRNFTKHNQLSNIVFEVTITRHWHFPICDNQTLYVWHYSSKRLIPSRVY